MKANKSSEESAIEFPIKLDLDGIPANFENLNKKARLRWRQHWWGTWFLDWLTCDLDKDFQKSAWLSFDIWAKAYREVNPELDEHLVSDIELIKYHYTEAMDVVFNSWIFFIWQLLQWPTTCIHQLVWQIELKFFCKF